MYRTSIPTALLFSCASFLFLQSVAVGAQQPASRTPVQRQPQATTPPASGQTTQLPGAPQAPAAQPTLSNAPQRTTATYDDWIVQCETQAGPPPRKVCEMTQLTQLQVQGKTQPFSRMIVPQPLKGMPGSMIIQVPVNISFATKIRIQTGDSDQGLEVPFSRCVPDGCFADFAISDEALAKFRSSVGAGKLSFADSAKRSISVPLSFNGFGKAYETLLKE